MIFNIFDVPLQHSSKLIMSLKTEPQRPKIGACIMATTLTLRAYRNEYNADLMTQIENGLIYGLTAVDGNDEVVYIEGTYNDLDKLQSLVYVYDPELIQAAFEDFKSAAQIDEQISAEFDLAYWDLRERVLHCINHAKNTGYTLHSNERYMKLYECFMALTDLNK